MIALLLLLLLAAAAVAAGARRAVRTRVGPPLHRVTVAAAAAAINHTRLPPTPPATAPSQAARQAGLVNVRDLAPAAPAGAMRTGAIYRGATPLALAPASARRALDALRAGGCITVLDLRSASEWQDNGAATAAALGDFPVTTCRIPLQEWAPFTRAFVLRLPLTRSTPILAAYARARIMRLRPPIPFLRRAVLRAVNDGGLPETYATILGAFGRQIAASLRAVTEASERGEAVMLCCKHGKDRTGIVAALLLHVVGADRAAVLTDYAASDGERAAPIDVPGLRGAPPAALAAVLDWLMQGYGSIDGYLDAAGFGEGDRERLRRAVK